MEAHAALTKMNFWLAKMPNLPQLYSSMLTFGSSNYARSRYKIKEQPASIAK